MGSLNSSELWRSGIGENESEAEVKNLKGWVGMSEVSARDYSSFWFAIGHYEKNGSWDILKEGEWSGKVSEKQKKKLPYLQVQWYETFEKIAREVDVSGETDFC